MLLNNELKRKTILCVDDEVSITTVHRWMRGNYLKAYNLRISIQGYES